MNVFKQKKCSWKFRALGVSIDIIYLDVLYKVLCLYYIILSKYQTISAIFENFYFVKYDSSIKSSLGKMTS